MLTKLKTTLGMLVVLGIGLFFLVGWHLLSQPAQARPDNPDNPAIPVLSGMPVFIQSMDKDKNKYVNFHLEKAAFRQLGKREFLVGKAVKKSQLVKDGWGGELIWVPIDNISYLVETEEGK